MNGYTIGNRKAAIIGVGFVGSSIAYALALKNIAQEIVLIDISFSKAYGEALDIRHGLSQMGSTNLYPGDYADCADCDLIIITAGRNRRSGETRLHMANDNVKILQSVIKEVQRYYTRGVILIISNPVDILTQKASQWMRLQNGMVFGSGCLLDTSRFVRLIADYTGVSACSINGYLVGEHGDNQVAIWSHVTVDGIPISEYCRNVSLEWNQQARDTLAQRTRNMGADIINSKGQTNYGIATCVCHLADAILNQHTAIASVTSPLQGEHGLNNISLSLPSIVGPAGVSERIMEHWSTEEYRLFFEAVKQVRRVLEQVE